MIANKFQTKRQGESLISSLLEDRKYVILTAVSAKQLLRDVWGLDVDWHMCSNVLDEMVRYGKAEIVNDNNSSGLTAYMMK